MYQLCREVYRLTYGTPNTAFCSGKGPATVLRKADGQFIYIVVAINYIDSFYSPLPPKRLENLLHSPNPTNMAALDQLYTTLLDSLPDEELQLALGVFQLQW